MIASAPPAANDNDLIGMVVTTPSGMRARVVVASASLDFALVEKLDAEDRVVGLGTLRPSRFYRKARAK